jgi:nucleoside 2-deoxyribosyltransferase
MMTRKLIYIAAPLFSDSEKRANEVTCSIVERYFDVFLPQRDGYLVSELISSGMNVDRAYRYVFDRDVDAIRKSSALIINLDGRVIDEGAAFELGVAFALGKPCIGYRTDVRTLLQWGLNPMIQVPLSAVLSNAAELDSWCSSFASTQLSAESLATGAHLN